MGYLPDEKRLQYAVCTKKAAIELSLLLGIVLLLTFCAGTAWGAEQGKDNDLAEHSPPAAAETCLPLLESIRQSSSSDVAVRNQRSAGKLAALSLALGMRYALQPSPGQGGSAILQNAALDSDDKAIDIIRYRDCVKQNALQISMKAQNQNFAALE